MQRRQLLQLGALSTASLFLQPQLFGSAANGGEKVNGRIRLNANENVYGPCEAAKEAVLQNLSLGNRYPIVSALPELKAAIADHHQVDESMVLITAGSFQALRIIGTTLSKGEGNHLAPDLSFSVLMRQSELMGCEWKKVPVKSDKGIDLKRMQQSIDADTKFLYVTNPNNPTGHFIPRKEMINFCQKVTQTHPLVIDEAYIEMVNGDESASVLSLVKTNPNLIVTRTFSKMYGLAGLRIGYIIANKRWVDEFTVWDQNGGLGVSNVAAHAALASLRDQDFVQTSKSKIDQTREEFTSELKGRGVHVYPSVTNFILLQCGDFQTELIPLLEANRIDIGIGRPGAMKDLSRISIGTDQEMEQLLTVIKQTL